jgi:hypothetical protein
MRSGRGRRHTWAIRRSEYTTLSPYHLPSIPTERLSRPGRRSRSTNAGCATTRCDGPRLHSFSGQSTKLSPKARINTLLGYTAPFDRHDWVVDRCGKQVEYIIDFYSGRQDANAPRAPGQVSFYLDVRPKLNSLEGIKMRSARWLGLA